VVVAAVRAFAAIERATLARFVVGRVLVVGDHAKAVSAPMGHNAPVGEDLHPGSIE
jgi:hypothetical protein